MNLNAVQYSTVEYRPSLSFFERQKNAIKNNPLFKVTQSFHARVRIINEPNRSEPTRIVRKKMKGTINKTNRMKGTT